MIGSLGSVVFEVSSERIRTFDSLRRSGSGRWVEHEVIGSKPIPEFGGPGLEQITLVVQLSTSLGTDPLAELVTLRNLRDKGLAVPFILNGRPITETLWVVESISEEWQRIDNRGRLLAAQVELTLKEYVE